MICAKCGTSNQAEAAYCMKCGEPLASGLSGKEQEELQRLKLHNERSKRVWFVILGLALAFIGGSIIGGFELGAIAAIVVGLIVALTQDKQAKARMRKQENGAKEQK